MWEDSRAGYFSCLGADSTSLYQYCFIYFMASICSASRKVQSLHKFERQRMKRTKIFYVFEFRVLKINFVSLYYETWNQFVDFMLNRDMYTVRQVELTIIYVVFKYLTWVIIRNSSILFLFWSNLGLHVQSPAVSSLYLVAAVGPTRRNSKYLILDTHRNVVWTQCSHPGRRDGRFARRQEPNTTQQGFQRNHYNRIPPFHYLENYIFLQAAVPGRDKLNVNFPLPVGPCATRAKLISYFNLPSNLLKPLP